MNKYSNWLYCDIVSLVVELSDDSNVWLGVYMCVSYFFKLKWVQYNSIIYNVAKVKSYTNRLVTPLKLVNKREKKKNCR
jgi:hypothetical protein